MFKGTTKDIITNTAALLTVIIATVNAYLQSLTGDINWVQLAGLIVVAIIGWFTGKDGDGKAKVV